MTLQRCLALLLLAAAAALPAEAGDQPTLTKADADAWLDGYLPYAIASADIAGAVVVVVKDGVVVTERGYGYADIAARKPVDPHVTLFRPGSTSKLFTWTAVMQQVEAGKLDLDRDVNEYLDFKIPPRDGQPITLRQIMTHTAGFEEALSGLMQDDPQAPPLGEVVKRWIPERVFQAGTTPAYSNYATALAGYIVERVSGEPFDAYIEHHVFQPAGMARSTFAEPLPAALAPDMAQGYALASQPAKPFETIVVRPAGSATASGDDMARFMLAHLDEDHSPLLKPETMRQMHGTSTRLVPPLNGMELGFYDADRNGRRIIAHGGDTLWFHSYLWLLPDEKTGLFLSMNSAGQGGANLRIRDALIDGFMDRYFPGTRGAPAFQPRPEDAAAMAGSYIVSRRSDSGPRRALNFLTQVDVAADSAGGLHSDAFEFRGVNGAPRDWVEIAPFVWKDRNSGERLAAIRQDGRVTRLSVDSFSPFMVYDRVPWSVSAVWLKPVLALSLLGLLILAASLPVGRIARAYYGAAARMQGPERTAHRAAALSACGVLAILTVWAVLLLGLRFQPLGGWVYALEGATIVLPPLLFLALTWLVLEGRRVQRRVAVLIWRGVLASAALAVLWFVVAFNLVHIGLGY